MSQSTNMIVLVLFAGVIAFGFIYLVRDEIKKMEGRKYKKLKGEQLLLSKFK